jgi:predicted HAD superfamily Cof-like phosphohydrolase
MIIELAKVREFMNAFGQSVPSEPTLPPMDLLQGRAKMIKSEVDEMVDPNKHELVDVFDSVLDQLYVAYGHAVACGFTGPQMLKGFLEVHHSNMTKFWDLGSLPDVPAGCSITEVSPGRYVVKDADGKVVKPKSYTPAELLPILNEK